MWDTHLSESFYVVNSEAHACFLHMGPTGIHVFVGVGDACITWSSVFGAHGWPHTQHTLGTPFAAAYLAVFVEVSFPCVPHTQHTPGTPLTTCCLFGTILSELIEVSSSRGQFRRGQFPVAT